MRKKLGGEWKEQVGPWRKIAPRQHGEDHEGNQTNAKGRHRGDPKGKENERPPAQ
jgi:hypothetical protein